ncbi:tuftelin isoform X2 [Hemicordylus capensis]|uniref:tuftelin isoform X2 n=1 Tax=Hemicordylus capensis TaxID=884348 RepID=UPI0023047A5A|nr:tuftelin isoform X2 [Hemicordylus capensis]
MAYQSHRRLSMPAQVGAGGMSPDLNFWGKEEAKRIFCSQDSVKILRLTLQNDLPGDRRDQVKQKPVGRAFAMVANRPTSNHSLASECIKFNDGNEEIIKVYLKARADDRARHEKSLHQLKSDSSHLQELPSEKTNGVHPYRTASYRSMSVSQEEPTYPSEDITIMRETTKRLFSKLQEAEKRHQSDRAAYETSISHYRREAEQSGTALKRAEVEMEEKDLKLEELQRLLTGMEKEHQALLQKMKDGELELEALRDLERDKLAEQERSAKLEKEVATLREKIHHLDDMLKSQQRKVRQMIEQLQNSKTVIQSKDAIIQELKERVSYLEAENLEMHDRMEHLIEKQINPGGQSTRPRSKSDKRPTRSLGPKPLPLIRVVET